MTLAERLIREHKVATIPGSHLRIRRRADLISCRAPDPQVVAEGLGRLVVGRAARALLDPDTSRLVISPRTIDPAAAAPSGSCRRRR